jgi:excisionase family DNA binding protein
MPATSSIVTVEPLTALAVKTKSAWEMLGCSNSYGYELIKRGEIDSYLIGRIRLVTTASIRAYVARKTADAKRDPAERSVRTEKATAASVAARYARRSAAHQPETTESAPSTSTKTQRARTARGR